MKVGVDDQRCRGHGVCVTLCPQVFTLAEDGYSVAENPNVPEGLESAVREAIDCCPEQAISEI